LPAETLQSVTSAANSERHTMVDRHPERFAAFAALPCGNPEAAAAELERTVTQLGFVGAMIFGTIGGSFLDDSRFRPILETAARLDVPLYLHPGPPRAPVRDANYSSFDASINRTLAQPDTGGTTKPRCTRRGWLSAECSTGCQV
jgi:predicted TIM-barrel fold metal-dependent hydrolase